MMSEKHEVAIVESKQGLVRYLAQPALADKLRTLKHPGTSVERFLGFLALAAVRDPKIYQCTKVSISECMARSVITGLPVGSALDMAYAVPFFNSKLQVFELVFIPGYQGLVEVVVDDGSRIVKIEARLVHALDDFSIDYGTKPSIHHVPKFDGVAGSVIGAYAVATFINGETQFAWMSFSEIEDIRMSSSGRTGPAWTKHPGEMQKKTVIRRLIKLLPKGRSSRVEDTLKYDNEVEGRFIEAEAVKDDDPKEPQPSRTDKLAKAVTEQPKTSNGLTPDGLRAKIQSMVMEMADGDVKGAGVALVEITKWESKDGKQHKGKSDVKTISDAACPVVFRNVKQAYEIWQREEKSMAQEPAVQGELNPREDDALWEHGG